MRFIKPSDVSEAVGIPFSDQQLRAICAPLEPAAIIAGAGSGKTTVMAARVVWLVGTGQVRAEQVLGLTFTRKAAAELGSRIRKALLKSGIVDSEELEDAGDPTVSTYDSFANRLVAEHGLRLGIDGAPRMLTRAGRHRLAERVVTTAPGPFPGLSRLNPTTVIERLLQLDSELTSHLVEPDLLVGHSTEFCVAVDESPRNRMKNVFQNLSKAASIAAERAELVDLVSEYRKLKRDLGFVEYADQMATAARLASQIMEVGATLRQQFKVVLLDEYQDTSSAQALLLRSLFGGGHPVTAVGDPHQAIYGWRGAAASNILSFASTFNRTDGSPALTYALTVNRRSGQVILDAANRLAKPLRGSAPDELGQVDNELQAPPGNASGEIMTASFDSWHDEVSWVADQIVALHDSGRAKRWSDIAVLSRQNAEIGVIYSALVERGVPAEIVGLGGLLSVPEVADVVATLKVIADPTANSSLIRLLTGSRWRLGPGDLAVLGARAGELVDSRRVGVNTDQEGSVRADADSSWAASLVEALSNPGQGPYSEQGRHRISQLAIELKHLRRHSDEPVENLVRRVISTLGLEVELLLLGQQGTTQIDAFLAAVGDYTDVDGDGSLVGFLAYLDAEQQYDVGLELASLEPEDAVRLATVHRAKGLEWSVVFLPALAEGVFPNDRVSDNWLTSAQSLPADLRGDADSIPQLVDVTGAAADEFGAALKREARRSEDRLAYVAVTRAKHVLVATTHAWEGTRANHRKPSPYLDTIQSAEDRVLAEEVSDENPLLVGAERHTWPILPDPESLSRRQEIATGVQLARATLRRGEEVVDDPVSREGAAMLAMWDSAASQLLAEAHRATSSVVEVNLPRYLSTTTVMALKADAQAWAKSVARPMPRPPVRASLVGNQFHAWLESRFSLEATLALEPDEEHNDSDLAELIAAFERGPFADRTPVAAEVPFSLVLAGQVVRGRIDAVFDEGGRALVVDWKTGRRVPDPLQLAVYRLAWAELSGVSADDVTAAFYDVRVGVLRQIDGLPGRAALEQLMIGLVELD